MATAANKNKIRTFEAEIGPQNMNIEDGKMLLVLNKNEKCINVRNVRLDAQFTSRFTRACMTPFNQF